jgi:hypothetical protein
VVRLFLFVFNGEKTMASYETVNDVEVIEWAKPALLIAKKSVGHVGYMISIDSGYAGTKVTAVDDSYIDSDEYNAFDGKILCEVFDDGTMVTHRER